MDDAQFPECLDAKMVIEEAYAEHVALFRDFAAKTEEWLVRYNKVMAPMLLECLSVDGKPKESDFQLLTTLTRHAERFVELTQKALAEYEEAYKVSEAVFDKAHA